MALSSVNCGPQTKRLPATNGQKELTHIAYAATTASVQNANAVVPGILPNEIAKGKSRDAFKVQLERAA